MCWIGNRDKHLHTAVEVAVHQIGRTDPDRWRSIVGEPEVAAVLQEPADNAADSDVLADSWHSWPDRADAAHPKVHWNTGLGSAIERIRRRLVNDRVDFDLDARWLAVLVVGDLVVDPVDQPVADAVRSNEQPLVLRLLRHSRQVVEKPADVLGDDWVGG